MKRYTSPSEDSESEASEMELDPPSRQNSSQTESEEEMEGDEEDQDQQDEEEDDSTDDYLLYTAHVSQLNRLKKGDLVRLYRVGNLPEDPELMTKAEIIKVILEHRDEDIASLPPSSPPGRSSDYSSDDGNVAGDEEDEPPSGSMPSPLRRRVTMNPVVKSPPRPIKGRSMSLGNVLQSNANGSFPSLKRKGSLRINTDTLSKQRSSNRSSPSTSAAATSTVGRIFPFHQLRSRKVSAPTPVDPLTPTSANSKGKGKGKAKQVEFSDEAPPTKTASSSKRHSKEKERNLQLTLTDESDLTEFDELPQPSPRRLRSKDREQPRSSQDSHHDPESTPTAKRKGKVRSQPRSSDEGRTAQKPIRITPMRRAKGKIKSLRESDMEVPSQDEGEEEEAVEEESEEELEEVHQEEEEGDDDEEAETEEPEDVDDENEVDELVSTASLTPPPPSNSKKVRRTPMRQRLRQRRGNSLEANQGDDEYEEEEVEEAEPLEVDDDDEVTIAVEEPRRLRNGKVVGDEDVSMDSAEEIIEEDESGIEEEVEEEAEEHDQAAEEELDEDEAMEDDDVDLTAATTKSLTRLRKDDLVRLCENRNLEPVGNKRELAEALLQWRDRHVNGFSSPSSTGTVRPPSTTRRGRKKRSSASTVPVLLRSHQIHTDEPRTPVPKEKEEELELDLESLGLEDREIPPEKITKLEKIGSGGFKDVFIGKFKGRRIAIAEFRGTLSAMDIKELKLLGGFDHPNIVRFLGVSIPENTKETPVMIVSELCSNGDLFDYIRNVNAPSLHKVLRMMFDIASGLEYLHTRAPSVIHRDCKSSNILITAKGIAKIADFGLAKVKESTRSMVRSLVGTVNWQAPELWTAHPCYNHKVDVFSCAMVFWEMLQWHVPNKQFPWEGMNEHAIYEVVGAKKQRPSVSGLRKQWCPEVVDLIDRMWAQDPRDRPTMTEVVQSLRELVSRY